MHLALLAALAAATNPVKLVLGTGGANCDETYAGICMRCVKAGLEEVSFGDGLARVIDGGCREGARLKPTRILPAFFRDLSCCRGGTW